MNIKQVSVLLAAAAIAATAPAIAAKKAERSFVTVNESVGVPVFPNDITDRPYDVVGEVKAGVRKATIFSSEASQDKIYKELWERADKLGADAVINAKYGESHVSAMSWGKTNATGTAIKFKASAAIAAPVAETVAKEQSGGAACDPIDHRAATALGFLQIIAVLQPQKKTFGHTEITAQSQVQLGIDRTLVCDQAVEKRRRNFECFGERCVGQSKRLHELTCQYVSCAWVMQQFTILSDNHRFRHRLRLRRTSRSKSATAC